MNGDCSQLILGCLCRSFLLTLFPCSSVGSHPWETVLHKLSQHGSFPGAAVLEKQAALAWVPCGVTSPASKPAPVWAPLSTGPQVLPGACSSAGSPWGHSIFWASPCSGVGSSPGCGWRSVPLWTSMDCRETTCLTMVCSMGCRGTSAPAPGAPPLPPSVLTLGSAELLLSHHLTPLQLQLLLCRFVLSPRFLTMLSQSCYHHR